MNILKISAQLEKLHESHPLGNPAEGNRQFRFYWQIEGDKHFDLQMLLLGSETEYASIKIAEALRTVARQLDPSPTPETLQSNYRAFFEGEFAKANKQSG